MAPAVLREHFTASNFRARELAIEAYDSADAAYPRRIRQYHQRHDLDPDRGSAAMREAQQDKTRATLAEQATGWVKPLVALAGGIINGGGARPMSTTS
jgi:hypothetical protein